MSRILKILFTTLLMLVVVTTAFAVEKITYIHNDELGSPVAATDSNRNVLWRESYRPYGQRSEFENKDTNETWYTGKQHDADLGLSYYGARWYDPNVGRFTGIDPVGVQEGNVHSFNRYAYANNNPYKFVDPDGNFPLIAIPIAFAIDVFLETALAPDVPFDSGQVQRSYVGLGTLATGVKAGAIGAKAVAAKGGEDAVDVFRAFGGDARAQGFSWTTKDPRSVSNFRDAAGLPSGGASGSTNTADFLIKGKVNAADIIKRKSADPLDGNKGGLPELVIDPKNVNITNFSVLKP